jgi:hypothetical protein
MLLPRSKCFTPGPFHSGVTWTALFPPASWLSLQLAWTGASRIRQQSPCLFVHVYGEQEEDLGPWGLWQGPQRCLFLHYIITSCPAHSPFSSLT